MKRFYCILLLLLSYCSMGQSKRPTPQDFINAVDNPVWSFIDNNPLHYTTAENNIYVQDSIVVLIRVYWNKQSTFLFGLNDHTGKLLWSKLLYTPFGVADNGNFIYTTKDSLICISLNTGNRKWSLNEHGTICTALYQSVPAVYLFNSQLTIVNESNGAIIKQVEIQENKMQIAILNDNIIRFNGKTVEYLSTSTGKKIWDIKGDSINLNSILSYNGTSLFYYKHTLTNHPNLENLSQFHDSLLAIDFRSGNVSAMPFEDNANISNLSLHYNHQGGYLKDSILYALADKNRTDNPPFYLVKIDLKGMRELWKIKTPLENSDVEGGQIYADSDIVYYVSLYRICLFSASTGKLLWKTNIGNQPEVSNTFITKYFFITETLYHQSRAFSFLVRDKNKPSNKAGRLVNTLEYIFQDEKNNALYLIGEENTLVKIQLPR